MLFKRISIDTGPANTGIACLDLHGYHSVHTISLNQESTKGMCEELDKILKGYTAQELVFELNTGLTATNMILIGYIWHCLESLPDFTGYVTPKVLKEEICGYPGAKKADIRTAVRQKISDLAFDEHGADALALLLIEKEIFTSIV